MNRRRFLISGGLWLPAAYLAACDSQGPRAARGLLRGAERYNARVESLLFRHRSMERASPSSRDAGAAFPEYYVADRVPVWNEAAQGPWMLEVSGAVERPLRFRLDELMKLRSLTQRVDHVCVEGWTAVASWTGVRVSELARLAGLRPDARFVDFQSFDDGYHESWDLASAMHPQTIVAYAMDGHMLGAGHGAPARLHSPIKLGYKLTKYLTRVVFLPRQNGGYWSDQGYEWYAGL